MFSLTRFGTPALALGLATTMPAAAQVYSFQTQLGVNNVSGSDTAHFSGPSAGAVDTVNGHFFVDDFYNNRVQVIDTSSLAVVAIIGVSGESGSDNAHFSGPNDVGFDPTTGRLFIADSGNQRVQIFDAVTFAYVGTLGATGVAGTDNAHFNTPATARFNPAAHQLYVADYGNNRVQIFDAGSLAYIATLGATGVAGSDNAHFNEPQDAEYNPSTRQIMVADSLNIRVQVFDAASFAYVATIGGFGEPADKIQLSYPVSAGFDPTTNLVLIADRYDLRIVDALTYQAVGTISNPQFDGSAGIAIDPVHGQLFVGDTHHDVVDVFSIAPVTTLASVLPGSRSVELGKAATIFATVINAGTTPLQNCRIALPVTAPAGLSLSYQTTNPANNSLTGTVNTPVSIAGNDGVQSFLVSFQGSEAFSAPVMPMDFDCAGAAPAIVHTGVDTVDLAMSSASVADIIALSATATGNGIAEIPEGGAGAFAVASTNVGVTAPITVSVDTGGASLPVTATICQSNPANGACLAPAAPSVTLTYAGSATPTFSVFLQSSGAIAFDPANSRVFVRFEDADGGLHGSTSVALGTTQGS